MLTITRALLRAVRTRRWSGRDALILALAAVLSVGTVVLAPTRAYAAVPEVRTQLHAGVDDSGPFAVFGSNVAFGTHRSTDTGATWLTDVMIPSDVTWEMAYGGALIGYRMSGASYVAVVFWVGAGTESTYPLPSQPLSMSSSWSLSSNGTAYNFVSGGSSVGLAAPAGSGISTVSACLTPTGGVLWTGTTSTGQAAYAYASSPTSYPSPWSTVDGTDAVATPDQIVYVQWTSTQYRICSRPLTNLAGSESCAAWVTGSYDTVYPQYANFGIWTLVTIWTAQGATGQYTSYIWNGNDHTSTKIALPAGTYIDMPPAAGGDQYGDFAPYALLRDGDTVPTIRRIMADGSVTPGFSIPPTSAASVGYLATAPDRMVGADTRDAARELQTWTRSVSGTGFAGETMLPVRSSGLKTSAARTVVSGPAGLSVYDRGAAKTTMADARLSQLSGPYVSRIGWDAVASTAQTEISTIGNTPVGTFLGASGSLFGSEFVTWAPDPTLTTSARVVTNDLTGRSSPKTLTLPAGTAGCQGGRVWSTMLFLNCEGTKLQAYNLTNGALANSLNAPQGQFVNLTDVGDGYGIVTFNNIDYSLWNIAQGSLIPLTDCTYDATSDGVGHVGCSSSTQLIWRDFSSVSTSAPRLLGTVTTSTVDFSKGATWGIDIDTTKPLAAGTLTIAAYDGSGHQGKVVRRLTTPASPDGSLRGITWDGLSDAGKSVQAGRYTYTLSAPAADRSGAVTTVDGSPMPFDMGELTITSANPAGMSPGALLSVSPSRLLDTRTTGPTLGAGQTRSLKVTGVGGVPSTGVSAVVLNVTVTDTTSGGYLTVSPTGTPRPVVSNLNWAAGATIPNAVTVKVGDGGSIDLYQSGPGSTNVIVDVAGYYIGGSVNAPGGFTSLTPARILDTRTGVGLPVGKLGSGQTKTLQVTGAGGVPASNVSAVVLNVTVTDTNAVGYLTAYPSDAQRPVASNLNWNAGATVANLVTVKLSSGTSPGRVSLFQSGTGSANVIADVAGYYLGGGVPNQPGMYVPVTPARVLDTRTTSSPVPGLTSTILKILGQGGVPVSGVSSVVVNATVTDTNSPGYLTAFPGTNALPTASNLNWTGPNATVANLVTTLVGNDGTIKLYNGSFGSASVIADTAGYFIGS